jgi:glycine betaine/choline ABC-type transport system substrate-binding protein
MKKLLVLVLLFVACKREPIHIGSKNFTESVILGELVAQKLESTGCTVDRKLDMGGTFVCDSALRNGAIDAYVEYSGTALEAILKKPHADLAAEYEKQHLHWGPALGFNNTFAMIVRRDPRLKKISDLHLVQNEFQPGFGYEFVERPDGWNGLLKAYALQFANPPKTMDLGLTYKALASNQVDLIAGNSTDGLIQSLGLAVLDDDRHYFPRYDAAVVHRDDIDRKCSGASKALDTLRGTIDDATMRQMNFEVDGKKRAVPDVVRDFLRHVAPSVSEGPGRKDAPAPDARNDSHAHR